MSSKVLSRFNFFESISKYNFLFFFLSSMTVNENIFDILFYWKEVIYAIMLPSPHPLKKIKRPSC